MTREQEDTTAWLSSVLPCHLASSNSCSNSGQQHQLELHRRIVHLATLREEALLRLQELDSVKVSLSEKKAVQQGRLIAALDARLSAAHAAVDPHRVSLQRHVQALEKAAGYYSSVMQGVVAQPASEEWAEASQKYQQLLQQQELQLKQQQQPAELASKLAASLQPSQVGERFNENNLSLPEC
jgi:hypothetical protein